MSDERRLGNGFERHIQTVIQVIITALVLWVGGAVMNVRDSAIRLEEKGVQVRADIVEIKAELAGLRTSIALAAASDIRTQVQIREIEARLGKIENIISNRK